MVLISLNKEDITRIEIRLRKCNPKESNKIKEIKGGYWFSDRNVWIIPFAKNSLSQLFDEFKNDQIKISKSFFKLRSNIDFVLLRYLYIQLHLHKYRKELKLEGYSAKTIKAYVNHINRFAILSSKLIMYIEEDEIKNYLLQLIEQELSASYVNQAISSIKLFFEIILNKNDISIAIPRPKKVKRLPKVLSRKEVKRIINSIINLKHKALICTIYSSGLRVSEVVRLKKKDIDGDRKMIFIRKAKGKKDRYSILSEKALYILREYVKKYRPEKWLFPGAKENNHLSERSVQKVFKKACRKAKITKDASVHTLRHAFATHLHENGVDIRYIQKLLGHKSSKTTEIYTHISKFDIEHINSPLDNL